MTPLILRKIIIEELTSGPIATLARRLERRIWEALNS